MKIIKEIPITRGILKECLMLENLHGERSLIEINKLQPSDNFIVKHMEKVRSYSDSIREKLGIGDYQISIDSELCCIMVFDKLLKDLSYETNYILKEDIIIQ